MSAKFEDVLRQFVRQVIRAETEWVVRKVVREELKRMGLQTKTTPKTAALGQSKVQFTLQMVESLYQRLQVKAQDSDVTTAEAIRRILHNQMLLHGAPRSDEPQYPKSWTAEKKRSLGLPMPANLYVRLGEVAKEDRMSKNAWAVIALHEWLSHHRKLGA